MTVNLETEERIARLLRPFHKGVTTPGDVVAKLGAPQETGQKDNGNTTLNYVQVKGTPKAATFTPVVGLFAGGTDVHSARVTLELDPAGIC
jgi:hypothetical protein